MNAQTIAVAAVVLMMLAAVAVRLVQNKKNHKSSCGCNCSGCPINGSCHSKAGKG